MPYNYDKRKMFLNLTIPVNDETTSYNIPSNVYLALFSNDPVADMQNSEVINKFVEITNSDAENGGFTNDDGRFVNENYERKLIARKDSDLPNYLEFVDNEQGMPVIHNARQITFNRADLAYEVKGIGLYEVAEGGDPTFYATLKSPVTVDVDKIFTFDPEQFKIQFSDEDGEISIEASGATV
ncbi:MAG: hypothetical protein J6J23_07085 [Clostridia bacterium]|nr:hypothetical protein [bacterium]MBP3631228.1 hypothetical protein [Clostridia bacterium]